MQGLVLRPERRVLLCDIAPTVGLKLIGVFLDLLADRGQVGLEVRNDLTPLCLLLRNDALVVFLQGLVLALVLAREDFVLAHDELSALHLLGENGLSLVVEKFCLKAKS